MLVSLKILLRNLILPPSCMLILMLAGVLLLWRQRAGGRTLLLTGFAGLWALCTPVIGELLTRAAEHSAPLSMASAAQAQAIVILGGDGARYHAPEYGGQPAIGREDLERVSYGAYVARATALPVLVSSGSDVFPMAASLARDFGIRARWVDSRSRDTFENARNSTAMLRASGVHAIVLVSSAVHVWRAAQEFRAAGMAVVPAPVGLLDSEDLRLEGVLRFVPSPLGLVRSQRALYELIGEPVRQLLAALHLRRQSG